MPFILVKPVAHAKASVGYHVNRLDSKRCAREAREHGHDPACICSSRTGRLGHQLNLELYTPAHRFHFPAYVSCRLPCCFLTFLMQPPSYHLLLPLYLTCTLSLQLRVVCCTENLQ